MSSVGTLIITRTDIPDSTPLSARTDEDEDHEATGTGNQCIFPNSWIRYCYSRDAYNQYGVRVSPFSNARSAVRLVPRN